MKPDYTQTLSKLTPLSEIVPRLFQGIRPGTYRGYDLVISCEQHLAKGPMEEFGGVVLHIPMRDDDEFLIPELAIRAAGLVINEYLEQRKTVLIHCTGGLNRSSLVTGRYLIDHEEMTPKEAVILMRAKRDTYVLCNRAFERWVLNEPLPTAETSAFREGAA